MWKRSGMRRLRDSGRLPLGSGAELLVLVLQEAGFRVLLLEEFLAEGHVLLAAVLRERGPREGELLLEAAYLHGGAAQREGFLGPGVEVDEAAQLEHLVLDGELEVLLELRESLRLQLASPPLDVGPKPDDALAELDDVTRREQTLEVLLPRLLLARGPVLRLVVRHPQLLPALRRTPGRTPEAEAPGLASKRRILTCDARLLCLRTPHEAKIQPEPRLTPQAGGGQAG